MILNHMALSDSRRLVVDGWFLLPGSWWLIHATMFTPVPGVLPGSWLWALGSSDPLAAHPGKGLQRGSASQTLLVWKPRILVPGFVSRSKCSVTYRVNIFMSTISVP